MSQPLPSHRDSYRRGQEVWARAGRRLRRQPAPGRRRQPKSSSSTRNDALWRGVLWRKLQVSLTLIRSLRDVAAELAKLGFVNERGAEFSASSVQSAAGVGRLSVGAAPQGRFAWRVAYKARYARWRERSQVRAVMGPVVADGEIKVMRRSCAPKGKAPVPRGLLIEASINDREFAPCELDQPCKASLPDRRISNRHLGTL